MMELIDLRMEPLLVSLGDWSVRWAILILPLIVWFAVHPPRTAAVRMLGMRLAMIAGLLLPLVPPFWGSALSGLSGGAELSNPTTPDIAASHDAPPLAPQNATSSHKSAGTSSVLRMGTDPGKAGTSSDPVPDRITESIPLPMAESLGLLRWAVILLSGVWALGFVVTSLRLAVGWFWLVKLRRTAKLVEDDHFLREFEQCRVQFRATRNAKLATHPSVDSPIIVGGLQPCILVPTDWQTLTPAARQAILLHELAHIQRRDDVVKFFDELVRAFFWFHPLVHWLLNRIDADREELCDRAVVNRGIAPRDLASVLIECCWRCGAGKPALALSAALPFLRQRSVKDRIQILMEENSMSRWTVRPSRLAVGLLVVMIAGICAAIGGFGARADEQAQPSTAATNADLPTVKEILVAYRENFTRLMPLALTYRLTQTAGVGEIEAERAQLQQDELLLKAAQATPGVDFEGWSIDGRKPTAIEIEGIRRHLAQLPEHIEDLKKRLEPEHVKKRLAEPMIDRYFVWTDGKSFHARWPRSKAEEESSLVRGPLTPAENLSKLYGSYELTSWTKSNSPPCRCFFSTQGRIAQRLDDCISMDSFAPLGFVNLDWAEEHNFNDLDSFMSHDASQYQVVKRDSLNGKTVLVVDGFFSPAEKNGYRYRLRAWIDPSQGFLPMRIDQSYVNSPNAESGNFNRVVDVLQVREIAGSYYPAQVKRQRLQYDSLANEKQRQEKEAGRLSADVPAPPLLPGRTYVWDVIELKPHQPAEPGSLELEFPQGATYVNAVENREYRVGDPEPLPQFKPLAIGDAAPPFQVAAWTDGKTHSMEEFRGKVVFIDFWRADIPETRQMVGMLKEVFTKYAEKDVVFVEIYQSGTDIKQLGAFQKEQNWKAFVGVDEPLKEQSGATSFSYNLPPGTFGMIGRDGKIAFLLGAVEEKDYMDIAFRACKALSIPWPIDEKGPPEQVAKQMYQIFNYMISEQLDKALGKP